MAVIFRPLIKLSTLPLIFKCFFLVLDNGAVAYDPQEYLVSITTYNLQFSAVCMIAHVLSLHLTLHSKCSFQLLYHWNLILEFFLKYASWQSHIVACSNLLWFKRSLSLERCFRVVGLRWQWMVFSEISNSGMFASTSNDNPSEFSSGGVSTKSSKPSDRNMFHWQ